MRSGVDINTIRRIYKYPTSIVTTETLGKIARVLEVDVSELIENDSGNNQSDTSD